MDDSRLVASYQASWTGASRQSSPPFSRGLVIKARSAGFRKGKEKKDERRVGRKRGGQPFSCLFLFLLL
jgi:hypothetical protein